MNSYVITDERAVGVYLNLLGRNNEIARELCKNIFNKL
jgi:hypothetical protein